MANNEINLYVRDATSNSAINENNVASKALSQTNNATAAASKGVSKGMMVAQTIAMGAFKHATSNIGKYSGDTTKQTMVDNVSTMVETGAMFMVNPLLGAANLGMRLATSAIDENFRKKQAEVNLNQARMRAGYTDSASNYRRR